MLWGVGVRIIEIQVGTVKVLCDVGCLCIGLLTFFCLVFHNVIGWWGGGANSNGLL